MATWPVQLYFGSKDFVIHATVEADSLEAAASKSRKIAQGRAEFVQWNRDRTQCSIYPASALSCLRVTAERVMTEEVIAKEGLPETEKEP